MYRHVEDVLLEAEAEISLIQSLTPTNWASESTRVLDSCQRGAPQRPQFVYVPASVLRRKEERARRALDRARQSLAKSRGPDPIAAVLRDRLMELDLEADLLAACGTDRVGELSAQRFYFEPELLLAAQSTAHAWTSEQHPEEPSEEALHPLLTYLSGRASAESSALGVSVLVVEADIASLAAVGTDCLYVRRGAQVTELEAARVWVHEVHAHLLPRLASKNEGPPFRIGTQGWSEDEEGRAVLLEDRIGALKAHRKRDLGVRFVLAQASREGWESAERVAKELLLAGTPAPLVAWNLARVLRGGGLAREIVYLPGYLRVRHFLRERPEAERLMERGRISVEGARLLSLS